MPHVFQIQTSQAHAYLERLGGGFEDLVLQVVRHEWRRELEAILDPERIYVYEPKISDSMPVSILVSIHAWRTDRLTDEKARAIEQLIQRRLEEHFEGQEEAPTIQVSVILVGPAD